MDFSDSLRDGFVLMDFSDCGCDLDEEDKENALDEEAKESMDKSVMSLYNDYMGEDDGSEDYDGGQSFQVGFLSGGEGDLAGSAEFSGVSCFSSRFDSSVAMTLADVAAVSDGLFRRASSSS
ncbi:hypothetical protein F2Q69_00007217 [Brassica cretica]|uniref:Uncharacterized protein n=1 Tax=Brassica cretica TaxID=69181 RepID=A0A8S9NSH6_BRACR|nr:hypothetical protein F2Q69_00007217 [Brassica cretica]